MHFHSYVQQSAASHLQFVTTSILIVVSPSYYRAFEDEKKARMGVVECANHSLLEPFNVLWEKEGKKKLLLNYVYVIYVCTSDREYK